MRLLKEFTKCDNCGKNIKSFKVHKGKCLCHTCYVNEITIIPSNLNSLYNLEPLTKISRIFLCLTKKQSNLLNKRLKFLFPNQKKKDKSTYVRELVLNDLKYFNKLK